MNLLNYLKKTRLELLFILVFAFAIRFYGINWDQGFHLHPDERMIMLVADRINFWNNLDPGFFNYGTFPIYLLRAVSELIDVLFKTNIANYTGMLTVGRFLSIFFDLTTIGFIYGLVRLIFEDRHFALLSSFIYSITFFAIQNTHFYVTDPILTCLSIISIYVSFKYLKSKFYNFTAELKYILLLGFIVGLILATKVSGLIFLPGFALVFLVRSYRIKKRLLDIFLHFFLTSFCFLFIVFCSFSVFMPYALINFSQFYEDISLQIKMNSDAYIFPYTLQYVGTTAYLYYLKNIFLWGIGPIISMFSLGGFLILAHQVVTSFKKRKITTRIKYILLLSFFYFIYFIVIGRSAVKFMRYFLPIYPFFAILAGYGVVKFSKFLNARTNFKKIRIDYIFITLFVTTSALWTLSFVSIYAYPHTRIEASNWILENIPAESRIAVEHWDDRLPLMGSEQYSMYDLPLYDLPDDKAKWEEINFTLDEVDYIIIASNRLYTPLQKLNDCEEYQKCYPLTAEYYSNLLSDQRGFKLVKEFSRSPLFINDQAADESFTVYDHPRILIFKKINSIN